MAEGERAAAAAADQQPPSSSSVPIIPVEEEEGDDDEDEEPQDNEPSSSHKDGGDDDDDYCLAKPHPRLLNLCQPREARKAEPLKAHILRGSNNTLRRLFQVPTNL